MCQFKSAIIVNKSEEPNGFDLLHNPFTDSHEELIRIFKLNDNATPRGGARFARVEFRPEITADLADLEKYQLIIDEQRTPEWFTEAKQKKVSERLRQIVAAMIITGEADMLCGGAYILAKGAKVWTVKAARIHVMLGNATISGVRDNATISGVWDNATIKNDNRENPAKA